jgi:hypothetical protein
MNVIPEKSLFSASAEECDFIRNPIWFNSADQMGFHINFLSRRVAARRENFAE